MGTPSYSPSIYGAILREYEPILHPALVVICVDDSDPQDDYLYRQMVIKDEYGLPISVYPEITGIPHFLYSVARHVKLVRLTGFALNSYFFKPPATDTSEDSYFGEWRNRYAHYMIENEFKWIPAFKRTLSLIDAIVKYCRERGILVAIVNYPYAPAVTKDYNIEWRKQFSMDTTRIYEPTFHTYQRSYAAANDIPYLDLTPFIRRLPSVEGIYNEADGHFSEKGNKLVAMELSHFLSPLINQTVRQPGSQTGTPTDLLGN